MGEGSIHLIKADRLSSAAPHAVASFGGFCTLMHRSFSSLVSHEHCAGGNKHDAEPIRSR
jgi:hypothetical protein